MVHEFFWILKIIKVTYPTYYSTIIEATHFHLGKSEINEKKWLGKQGAMRGWKHDSSLMTWHTSSLNLQ